MKQALDLLTEYRARCFWFLREDYTPATPEEWMRFCGFVERYGDRAGFQKAEEIKRWLSQHSKATS
ncbi:MAG: hypothetical protein LBW77_06815 [Verrucomicrobiota bacterium]|nr:hypothetical protein [Verrucomicrobiota bacterium]